LFRPFVQLESSFARRGGGAGLGLSISRHLVETMGGRIWVESELARGSTFAFELPLPEPLAAASRPSGVSVNLRGLRALVCDDNAAGRLILREMLSGWGATVDESADCDEVVARMRLERYDVLVLATNLPGGVHVIRAVRAEHPATRLMIMLVVSDLAPADEDLRRELGIHSLLVKPVKRRDILDALAGAMASGEWRVDRTRAPTSGGLRILVADDSEDGRMLVAAFLADSGHRIEFAANGGEAVALATATRYDLVFMDLEMPVLDGIEATRRIRAHEREHGHLPTTIIALTAHALPEYEERILAAGANGQLIKPIRKAALVDTVAAVTEPQERVAERVHVAVTPTVAPLVPTFLANRKKDAQSARSALKRRDFHALWVLAHTMKGLGSSYGFEGISDIGAEMEQAALAHEETALGRALDALERYLAQVDYSVAS
jgi:CheY-like chemotaxis protein